MRKTLKGFTLIELLIVVAIIAILAAIAVPNFLEAQVRSKVSRCKADMRSIATALEAYSVDHNGYPTFHYTSSFASEISFTFGGTGKYGGINEAQFNGNPLLTTPMAYITSIPLDPFYADKGNAPLDCRWFMYVNWPFAFRDDLTNASYGSVMFTYGDWRMTSGGPDKSRGRITGDYFNMLYDPSNGTVSLGQIHRTKLSSEGIPRL